MSYKVKLEVFEGPLDLLLYLVKKDHLNICDIPIAEVTEQYLQYIELMRLLDLNIAGEFLVMASTLINIKSKMLLPAEEKQALEEEEEDPRQELVNRLIEYQRFKEAAGKLKRLEDARREVFTRDANDDPAEIDDEVYFEASLFDLIAAFRNALKEVPKDIFYEVIKDEFTVEQKIHDILHLLLIESRILLSELFNKARSKIEIVSTFLAILELIRLKEVKVRQKGVFGEVEVIRNAENIKPHATGQAENTGQSES
ncbi:MAG: segregation/condensation protein A [Candidatus Omnitrophica bacterium]|nr:segregation/condensation protein A [Candidatus Omnitrophota bacterium]